MENHKIISILKTLSKKELNSFVRLVNTPYFNRKDEVISLIEYLKKQYPEFDENLIKKERVFKVISKEKTYNTRLLDDTIYHSIKLLEQFLVMEHINNNDYRATRLLAKELKNRKLKDFSLKEIEKAKKLFSENEIDLQSDFEMYSVLMNEYILQDAYYTKDDLNSILEANLKLDLFYWKNKLKINDEFISRREITNELTEILNKEELSRLSNLVEQNSEDIVLKILYFLNSNTEECHFELVFKEFQNSFDHISNDLQLDLITGLTNYCKKNYAKTQNLIYTKHWFNLYQFGYDKKVFLKNNTINDTSFLNIVHLGLVHKEHDWVSFFINDYKKYLSDDKLFNLALAMLNFGLEKYDIVIQELLEVNFGHIHQNIAARSLIAKTYYKMKEFDLLDNHLKAYDIYLRRRTEISEDLRQVNLNFITALKKLVLVQFNDKGTNSLNKYLDENSIAYKSWFGTILKSV